MSEAGMIGLLESGLILFLGLAAGLALDDLFVDAVALWKGLRPKEIDQDELKRLRRLPQKSVAVVVANWHEEDVIERMLRGNLARVEYARVWFFVGVYPNDPGTLEAARRVARQDSRVIVVENPMPGPTTKGQMLNVIFRRAFEIEERMGHPFDLFMMHDSEDVLHPQSLLLINSEADRADFVQIPVFSFPRRKSQFVASTYIDEFSELHTKDLLVRDAMNAGVPSAGVGTAISRKLVMAMMARQDGQVLIEGSLTEDYILGLTASEMGFQTRFVSRFIAVRDKAGRLRRRDFIATREYFPSEWERAVRQKGRWVHGIVLQGGRMLSVSGSLARRYFLMRDRKGPIAAAVGVLGIALLALNLLVREFHTDFHQAQMMPLYVSPIVLGLFGFNLFAGLVRAIQRVRAVRLTQDWSTAILSVVRIPIGNFLNFFAVVRAIRQDRAAVKKGEAPKWTKTTHELPADFGLEVGDGVVAAGPPVTSPSLETQIEKQVQP